VVPSPSVHNYLCVEQHVSATQHKILAHNVITTFTLNLDVRELECAPPDSSTPHGDALRTFTLNPDVYECTRSSRKAAGVAANAAAARLAARVAARGKVRCCWRFLARTLSFALHTQLLSLLTSLFITPHTHPSALQLHAQLLSLLL
jgi:hypothetical protein